MKELKIKKCLKCGALVKVFEDCTCDNCGIRCCDEEMKELKPNEVDASFEKHIPTYEIKDNMLYIKVDHVMEDDHFIEWISIIDDNKETITYFNSGETPAMSVKYAPGIKVYSYCNKHGLWMTEVE
jgi:superoxide reductase